MLAEKDEVLAKVRELNRDYPRGFFQDASARQPDFFRRILIRMKMRKLPFQPGDDVWTRMEEKTRSFVEEMSGRH